MAVDTSIYGQIRPFRMRDPLEAAGNALAVQQAQQTNALRAQQMQYAQEDRVRADQRRQGVNALLSRGLSPEETERELMRSGFTDEAFRLGKERRDNAKTDADTRATNVKTLIEQMNRNAQLLRSANDQQSWSALRQLIAQAEGPDVASRFPEQFDPRIRDAMVGATLKEADRLQNETTRLRDVMTDARTRAEGEANRAVQMRGQNMTDARARELADIQRAQSKAPPGYRFTPEGNLEAIPGGPAEKKADQRVKQAGNALALVDEADQILSGGNVTGSTAGALRDRGAALFGVSTDGAQGIARLKVLEAGLIQNMPRMEGPQSNLDVQLYREAAAQIGDPSVPNETKRAALTTVRRLNEKYAGIEPSQVNRGAPPSGAIDLLRQNPALAPQFDAKYGQGAAARVLGGR